MKRSYISGNISTQITGLAPRLTLMKLAIIACNRVGFFYIHMQYPGNVAERKTTPCNKGYIANACLWPFTLAIEAAALLMAMGSKYPLHLSTCFYHKNPCIIYMTMRESVTMVALWHQNLKNQHH